jgi:hypothetical protein
VINRRIGDRTGRDGRRLAVGAWNPSCVGPEVNPVDAPLKRSKLRDRGVRRVWE